jgi:hypothetical protein
MGKPQAVTTGVLSGLLVIALSCYIVAYIALGNWFEETNTGRSLGFRGYANQQQAKFFRPASKVESYLRGMKVTTVWPATDDELSLMSEEEYRDHIGTP